MIKWRAVRNLFAARGVHTEIKCCPYSARLLNYTAHLELYINNRGQYTTENMCYFFFTTLQLNTTTSSFDIFALIAAKFLKQRHLNYRDVKHSVR
jgi:hypothetical protein